MNEARSLSLKHLRKKYGLEAGGQIVIEEGESGLILRSGVTFSIEKKYIAIAIFQSNNAWMMRRDIRKFVFCNREIESERSTKP